jgi:gluconokinase
MAMAIVLMGVSGCGKTTVGHRLREILGWSFYDGDDFHPVENVEKMSLGIPLDDDDRALWLAILHDLIANHLKSGRSILLACSALKKQYRDQLIEWNPGVEFVYLQGDFDLIFSRMQARTGHYMKADMLRSQFDTLEEPINAVVINIYQGMDTIVEEILQRLHLNSLDE